MLEHLNYMHTSAISLSKNSLSQSEFFLTLQLNLGKAWLARGDNRERLSFPQQLRQQNSQPKECTPLPTPPSYFLSMKNA